MARKKVTPEEEIVNTAVEGTALGNPDDPLALHTGDGCNVSSGVQPCHAEKVSGSLSVSGKAQEKWFMQSVFRVKSGLRLCQFQHNVQCFQYPAACGHRDIPQTAPQCPG